MFITYTRKTARLVDWTINVKKKTHLIVTLAVNKM